MAHICSSKHLICVFWWLDHLQVGTQAVKSAKTEASLETRCAITQGSKTSLKSELHPPLGWEEALATKAVSVAVFETGGVGMPPVWRSSIRCLLPSRLRENLECVSIPPDKHSRQEAVTEGEECGQE